MNVLQRGRFILYGEMLKQKHKCARDAEAHASPTPRTVPAPGDTPPGAQFLQHQGGRPKRLFLSWVKSEGKTSFKSSKDSDHQTKEEV